MFTVPTFSNWQISLTFPWLFQYFFPFSSILFNEFNKYRNLFNKDTSTKKSENKNKYKNWLKSHFFSILGKFPSFFPVFWVKFPDFSSLFEIPRLEKFSHFPGFPLLVGTMDVTQKQTQKFGRAITWNIYEHPLHSGPIPWGLRFHRENSI